MANRYWKDEVMTLEKEIRQIHGIIVFGAAGAITTQDLKGFTVAKTATETGRYTITMGSTSNPDTYYEFKNLQAIVQGPTDAALTATDGYIPVLRNVDVSSDGFQTVDLQLTDYAGADKNATSGNKLYVTITVKNSSVDF